MEEFPTMSFKQYSQFLSEANIRKIINSRKKQGIHGDFIESITLEDSLVEIDSFLGSGGTKEVYSVKINGNNFALGICGILDHPQRILGKWSFVLNEPKNSNLLMQYGLITNDLCKIKPIKINGFSFPAIIMKRYQDHLFPIYDSKNRGIGLSKADFYDVDSCLQLFQGIVKDINILLQNNIWLTRDHFNLCRKDELLRLYFNDLGNVEFYRICRDEINELKEKYVGYALSAFIEGFRTEVIKSNPFLDNLREYDSINREYLKNKITNLIITP